MAQSYAPIIFLSFATYSTSCLAFSCHSAVSLRGIGSVNVGTEDKPVIVTVDRDYYYYFEPYVGWHRNLEHPDRVGYIGSGQGSEKYYRPSNVTGEENGNSKYWDFMLRKREVKSVESTDGHAASGNPASTQAWVLMSATYGQPDWMSKQCKERVSKNDCLHLTDADFSPMCHWKDSTCQPFEEKVVAICESGCPDADCPDAKGDCPWPKQGSWKPNWRILAPAGDGNAAASTLMQASASCCRREPQPCDHALCPGLPLVGCLPSPGLARKCCENFDLFPQYPIGCMKRDSPADVCAHSSLELQALRDGNALHEEEQGTNKVLPIFA